MGIIEPRWPPPPPSQDEIWAKVKLSTVLDAGPAGLGGGNFVRATGGGRDGDIRTTRSSFRLGPGFLGHDNDSDDFLEAGLCLSMSSLQPEEIGVLVGRAKDVLLQRLSRLCDRDDVFCEAITQRIYAMHCVHAAMTRQRVVEAKYAATVAAAAAAGPMECGAVSQLSAADVLGKLGCVKDSGDARLGLQLLFSLLEFVEDPECGQEQLADFLGEIFPVLSSLPPLCLSNEISGSTDDERNGVGTNPIRTPGVVHALREFLVRCILAKTKGDDLQLGEVEAGAKGDRATMSLGLSQRDIALSALVGLVAARGRASDLLVLVKVLLDEHVQRNNVLLVQMADEARVMQEETELRKAPVHREGGAKRYVASLDENP